MGEFCFGKPALNERGYRCCAKPQGCTNTSPDCAYLKHPYKRWVRGEITLGELELILLDDDAATDRGA